MHHHSAAASTLVIVLIAPWYSSTCPFCELSHPTTKHCCGLGSSATVHRVPGETFMLRGNLVLPWVCLSSEHVGKVQKAKDTKHWVQYAISQCLLNTIVRRSPATKVQWLKLSSTWPPHSLRYADLCVLRPRRNVDAHRDGSDQPHVAARAAPDKLTPLIFTIHVASSRLPNLVQPASQPATSRID